MRKLVEHRDLKHIPRLNRQWHIENPWVIDGHAINYLRRKKLGLFDKAIHLMKLTLKHWFK